MFERRVFDIPDVIAVVARLVEVVPSDWSWLDGGLSAPQSLVDSGQVAAGMGYAIQRFHSIRPTIVDSLNPGYHSEQVLDLYGLIAERRFPEFIQFDEAGYSKPITLELAKSIAIAYIRLGYLGILKFYSSCYDNSKYDNAERCHFHLHYPGDAIGGISLPRDVPFRALELRWDERYGGKEEHLEPILSVCRSLGLRELTPEVTR